MGTDSIRLLLVEDNQVDQMAFKRFVKARKLPYDYTIAGSLAEAEKRIAAQDFDIVISDYMLGDGTLFDLFDLFAGIPVIVTTGAGNEEVAASAMKAGACDYLIKDDAGRYLSTLPYTVESAVKHKKAEEELESYRRNLESLVKDRTAELNQEITEHRKTAESLRKSEELYRTVFNQAGDSILLLDPETGTFIDFNEKTHANLGYSREEFARLKLGDIETVEDEAAIKAHFKKLQTGEIDTFETVHKTKSGAVIDVFVTANHIRLNEKGCILSIWRDISERKRVQETLRLSEENLRSLMANATDFVIYRLVCDETEAHRLKVSFTSPSIATVLGLEPEKCTADTLFENVHPEDLERVTAANAKAFETNRFDEIFRFYNPQKEAWVWIHAIATGVKDAAGQLLHVNGIYIDVTAKQAAEQALTIKSQNLEETNIALNVLLKKREQDKTALEEHVVGNVEEMVVPFLEKAMNSKSDSRQKALLEITLANLREITSKFSINLSSRHFNLSPAEITVANFIKHGKNTKDIAALLNISAKTVKNHRQKIREKVGINNKKMNLRTYLSSFTS